MRVEFEIFAFEFEEEVPLFVFTVEVRLLVERFPLTAPSLETFSLEEVDLELIPSLLEVDLALVPSLNDVLRLESLLLRNEELLPSEREESPLPADISERDPEER